MLKVSIIIPIYKVEEYIERCLISVFNQSYDNLEIILVDDASPDRSMEIAKEVVKDFKKENNVIILTHERNRGLSAARNTGIDKATGEYIFFIDSDDELSGNTVIEQFVKASQKSQADITAGNYIKIFPNKKIPSVYSKETILQGDNLIKGFTNGSVPITAWNKLIKRSFIETNQLRFREGIITEDELFAFQTFFKNPIIKLIGLTSYNYYMRGDSISASFNLKRISDSIVVYKDIISSYKTSKLQKDDPRILKNFDRIAFNHYVEILSSNLSTNEKREAYSKLKSIQRSFKGNGKLRFIFCSHIYLPKLIGFPMMSLISSLYLQIKYRK